MRNNEVAKNKKKTKKRTSQIYLLLYVTGYFLWIVDFSDEDV